MSEKLSKDLGHNENMMEVYRLRGKLKRALQILWEQEKVFRIQWVLQSGCLEICRCDWIGKQMNGQELSRRE